MKGYLTISRPTFGSGKEVISIEIKDDSSNVRFIELEVSLADFTMAITGRCELPCEFKVKGLGLIGKIKEVKQVSIVMPENSYNDRKGIAKKLVNDNIENGWKLWDSFNSKDSFTTIDGVEYCNASICRYV